MNPKGNPIDIGTRCTVQRHSGDFCDAPAAEDMPFPICTRHALELYRRVREMVEGATRTPDGSLAIGDRMLAGMAADREKRQSGDVVYYVMVGDMIKIGYTSDLRKRVAAYPPGRRLLAIEDGSKPLEQQRLRQFASLCTGGKEWHRAGEPLVEHINQLRRTMGKQPVSLT